MVRYKIKDQVSNLLIYTLFLFVIGCFVYAYEPYPTDDFLRHIRYLDYEKEGGYAYMYPYSNFEKFSFNPWYGFDLIAGLLKDTVGSQNTVLVFEIFFVSLFFIALILNIRNPEEEKDWIGLYVFLAVFLISYYLGRLTLIRPTILIAIITLICLKGRGTIAGFIVTTLSAFLYYLFFLFFIPLAIAHYFKGCRRFALGVSIGIVISLSIWVYQTDFEFFSVLWLIASGIFDREGVIVSENTIFISKLTAPFVFLLTLFFVVTVLRTLKIDIYLLLISFTMPLALQARYFLDITIPLMFIYGVRNSLELKDMTNMTTNAIYKKIIESSVLISLILLFPAFANNSIHSDKAIKLEGINLPKGSVIFGDSLATCFSTIYWNKELVRVLPAAEIGWSDSETKKMVKKIGEERKVNSEFCSFAKKYGITHVITQHPVEGECFTFTNSFNKGLRVDLFAVK